MTTAQYNARQSRIFKECMRLKKESDTERKKAGKEIRTYWNLSEVEESE